MTEAFLILAFAQLGMSVRSILRTRARLAALMQEIEIAGDPRSALSLGEQTGQAWLTSYGTRVELVRIYEVDGRAVYDCDVLGKSYPPGTLLHGSVVRVAPLPAQEARDPCRSA